MSVDDVIIKYLSEADIRLVESIVYQQLAGSATSVIYGKFMKYYDNYLPLPEQILSTPDSVLKSSIGLSNKSVFWYD